MDARAWFCVVDGRRQGPVDADQLVALLRSREDSRTVLVWHEGMSDGWVPAANVEELACGLSRQIRQSRDSSVPPAPPSAVLPPWADEMRQVFRAGATSQFVLHSNVFDLVPAADGKGGTRFVSLGEFLAGTMFQPFDVVIHYDRGRGLRVEPPDPQKADAYAGVEEVLRFLKGMDAFRGAPGAFDAVADSSRRLELRNQLPRDPKGALEIVDRVLAFTRQRTKVQDGKVVASPLRVAVILDYAHFIAPQGDPIHVADLSQTLIQIQDWAANPGVTGSCVVTVLISENLSDLNRVLVESPYSAKIRIDLPTADEIRAFVLDEVPDAAEFEKASEVPLEELADKLVGLSRVSIRSLVRRALTSGKRINGAHLTPMRRQRLLVANSRDGIGANGRMSLDEIVALLETVAQHLEGGQTGSRFPLVWRLQQPLLRDGAFGWSQQELAVLLAEIGTIERECEQVAACATPLFAFGDEGFPEVYGRETPNATGSARTRFQRQFDELRSIVVAAQIAGAGLAIERGGQPIDWWAERARVP